MYLSRIQLRKIRGFRDLDLDLTGADGVPRPATLVIGRNGTCKTTLLRAVALGLCDPADAQALLSEPIGGMVSEGSERGEIEIEMMGRDQGAPPLTIEQLIERSDDKEFITAEDKGLVMEGHRAYGYPEPLVCGYGAGRYGVGSEIGRKYRVADSVYSLFDPRRTLIDTELTLRRLRDYLGHRKYDATLIAIKKALDLRPDDEIRLPKGGGIELSGPSIGRRVRLEAWADGYRVTFSWLLDLFGWAMRADRLDDQGNVVGIVVVDELEQHLHPSMQSNILPHLVEILPQAQLIATTHSPLVALGASPGELVVLRRQGNEVFAEASVPDFTGYSAEDMLVDGRLFDSMVYSPETNSRLARYRELAGIQRDRRTESEASELRALVRVLTAQQLPEVRDSAVSRELQRLVEKHAL